MENTIPKIKYLNAPVDYYGKTFIVLTICKEDLTNYFTKSQLAKLDDNDMSNIAEKLGEALMEGYWDCLSVICDYYKEDLMKK